MNRDAEKKRNEEEKINADNINKMSRKIITP